MKKIYLISIICTFFISACSSEVDKCVEAEVKAWEAKKLRIEKSKNESGPSGAINLWDSLLDDSVNKSKEEIASEARLRCLRVAGTGRRVD